MKSRPNGVNDKYQKVWQGEGTKLIFNKLLGPEIFLRLQFLHLLLKDCEDYEGL